MINQELYDTILTQVRTIISNETGNDFEEILPDSIMDEELEIGANDLIRIITAVNDELEISLNAKEIVAEESVTTVRELAAIACEEVELG